MHFDSATNIPQSKDLLIDLTEYKIYISSQKLVSTSFKKNSYGLKVCQGLRWQPPTNKSISHEFWVQVYMESITQEEPK